MQFITADLSRDFPQYLGRAFEIEARFGRPSRDHRFNPGVSLNQFVRVKDVVMQDCQETIETESLDKIYGHTRVTIENNQETQITKIKKNFDLKEYNIRISASQEVPSKSSLREPPTEIREKKRTSCRRGNLRFDFTVVKSNEKKKYEIEIELLPPLKKESLAELDDAIGYLLPILQGTHLLYTDDEYFSAVDHVNQLLGASKGDFMSHHFLIHLRNLKIEDIVPGGLISEDQSYSATIKAEGERRWLFIDDTATFLVMPPDIVDKIADETENWEGSLFEGEWIESSETLYLYDCLFKNKIDYRKRPHQERLEALKDFVKSFTIFSVEIKEFVAFSSIQEFFAACNYLLDKEYPFPVDGLVLTPYKLPYDPSWAMRPLDDFRRLDKYPDVCKWKPWDKLTIDFKVVSYFSSAKRPKREYKLYSNERGREEAIEFTSDEYPFSSKDLVTAGLENVLPDSIVEFGPNEEGKLVKIRVRADKTKPNNLDIARDIWRDIKNPLKEGTIRGREPGLIHNAYQAQYRSFLSHLPKEASLLVFGEILPSSLIQEKKALFLKKGAAPIRDKKIIDSDFRETEKIYQQAISFLKSFNGDGFDGFLVAHSFFSFLFECYENLLCLKELMKALLKKGGYIFIGGLDGLKVKKEARGDLQLNNLPLLYYILDIQPSDYAVEYTALNDEEISFFKLHSWVGAIY